MPDDPPRRRRGRRSRRGERAGREARGASGSAAAGPGRRGGLRRRTRAALRATEPPTNPIPVWLAPDGVDQATGRAVLDLAVRAGTALLATGAAAADVVATVLRLTQAYGLRSVHVDVTFGSITVSYHRGPTADPLTLTRIVRNRTQDYTRLERLRGLVEAVVADPGPVPEVRERFDAVIRAPNPYRRWVVTAAVAVMGLGTSILAGADVLVVLTSVLSAAVIARATSAVSRAGVPSFFTQAVGAAIPTLFAVVLAVVQQGTGALRLSEPSLVVASGIVVLLSGLSVVGAAQDAIEGFYVTAAARTFQVLVLTLGIVVGIVVVLAAAKRLGLVLAISPDSQLTANVVAQVVAAALIAAGFAVSSHTSPTSTLLAAFAGAVGWVVSLLLGREGGSPFAAGIAAAVIGFGAQTAGRTLRISALAITTAAIVPLLPGRAVYQGLFQIVSDNSGAGLFQGLGTLLGAAGVGMGLAAGVSLGTYSARYASAGLTRIRARRSPLDGSVRPSSPRSPRG